MLTLPSPHIPSPLFTRTDLGAPRQLRARYAQERDIFSPRKLARLRFLRSLFRRGRLVP
jgi:hypothetical protein